MGMPPATLASMATLMPARMARSQISGPHAAMSSLLAVTTDLRLAMAASTISAATLVPPTSSATMSTSGCATTSRQSGVRKTGPSDSGIRLVATDRQQTAVTLRRNPSFSAIWSALPARMASVPEPTLPRPTIPTFTFPHTGIVACERSGSVRSPDRQRKHLPDPPCLPTRRHQLKRPVLVRERLPVPLRHQVHRSVREPRVQFRPVEYRPVAILALHQYIVRRRRR